MKQRKFDVYLDDSLLATYYYSIFVNITADDVYHILVKQNDYNPNIKVVEDAQRTTTKTGEDN